MAPAVQTRELPARPSVASRNLSLGHGAHGTWHLGQRTWAQGHLLPSCNDLIESPPSLFVSTFPHLRTGEPDGCPAPPGAGASLSLVLLRGSASGRFSAARPPAPLPALRAPGCGIRLLKRQTDGEPRCVDLALWPPVLRGLSLVLLIN